MLNLEEFEGVLGEILSKARNAALCLSSDGSAGSNYLKDDELFYRAIVKHCVRGLVLEDRSKLYNFLVRESNYQIEDLAYEIPNGKFFPRNLTFRNLKISSRLLTLFLLEFSKL